MFQDLRAGMPIYMFDKKDLTAYAGEVVRIENQTDQFGNKVFVMGLAPIKVAYLDIVASINGMETQLKSIKADTSISDSPAPNGAIICDNRQEFIEAIQSFKKTSERILSEVDRHREIVERCDVILSDFDPKAKAEKEQSQEIAQLKSDMSDIKNMLAQVLKGGSSQKRNRNENDQDNRQQEG